jgi:hypothetical protein
MKNLKKVFGSAVTAAFLLGGIGLANVSSATEVSPIGQTGFAELSRCLNSNDILDVYYMIDESSSLSIGSTAGSPGSDPNDDRATILASSVESLQGLRPGLTVNVGVATFAKAAIEKRPWTELNEQTTPELADWMRSEIPNLNEGTATNWESALAFSQIQLNKSSSDPTDRCQALVWFTDGYLNVDNDRMAMGNLCGKDHIRQEEFVASSSSVVSEMRASGITILGIQLQDKNWDQTALDYASLMRSIVEGEGSTGLYAGYTCGDVPVPATSRVGALLIAQNPFDLAFQFQAIGQQANGGSSVLADGANPAPFLIEPGVASFKAVTTDPQWELTAPDGTQYSASNAGSSGFQVTESSGAILISRAVTELDLGEWKMFIPNLANNKREVYLFSGLGISIYNADFFDGEKGSISGTVRRELDGKPVDLSVYLDATELDLSLVDAGGLLLSPFSFPINPDGSFEVLDIDYPSGRSDVDMRLQLNLKTQSGIQLAPVSFGKVVSISLRKDYPTVSGPIVMSALVGTNPSIGIIELRGPEAGNGQICIGSPKVRDSETNRVWKLDGDSSSWSVGQSAVSNAGVSCVDLAQGETKTVEVTLQHSQTSDSMVAGEIPFTLIPGDKTLSERKINEPIEFESSRLDADDKGIVYLWEVILILLGILVPLALLYGLTLWSTKFSAGTDLVRKQVPVDISAAGVRIREDGNAAKSVPVAPMDDTREFKDASGLATLSARVSKFVFPAPWFEASAPSGTRLVSYVAPPSAKAVEFVSGRTVAIGPDVGKHSYFAIKEADLTSSTAGDLVKADLVIYSRLGANESNRLNDVLMMPGTWDRVCALRAKVAAEGAEPDSGTKKGKSKKQKDTIAPEDSTAPNVPSPPAAPGSNPSPPPPPGNSGGSVRLPPPPPGNSGGSVPPPPPV